LIGGGFATGREIIEYGGKFGNAGWISGLAIYTGFTTLAFLSFEACRRWKVYDYKSLLSRMLGKGWVAYELCYLMLSVLTIAVMASAAGEILKDTFGLDAWVGVVLIVIVVGMLNYGGEEIIARMETIGTIALFGAYLWFSSTVFNADGSSVVDAFTRPREEGVQLWAVVWTGILYVGYNLGVYPASFFTIRTLQSTKESLAAALVAGILMTLPWFLTYFSFMAYYPDVAIMDAPVPWLKVLSRFGSSFKIVFGVVVGWTLIETATGVIHAFVNRVEVAYQQEKGIKLQSYKKGLISLIALTMALILSRVGIIDLIAKGYAIMAYGMIAFYALPLLLWSVKILNHPPAKL
jgi:uncharacterized membrane protein YkvI